jgi:hypothetical protein
MLELCFHKILSGPEMPQFVRRYPIGSAASLPPERPVEKLAGSPLAFRDCVRVTGASGEIRVSKCDSSVRRISQNVAWRGFSIFTEKKSWLRARVSMSPTVENNTSQVALGIEARPGEHLCHLHTNAALVIPV